MRQSQTCRVPLEEIQENMFIPLAYVWKEKDGTERKWFRENKSITTKGDMEKDEWEEETNYYRKRNESGTRTGKSEGVVKVHPTGDQYLGNSSASLKRRCQKAHSDGPHTRSMPPAAIMPLARVGPRCTPPFPVTSSKARPWAQAPSRWRKPCCPWSRLLAVAIALHDSSPWLPA